jgi:peptidoglycan hydrolase-like protein with peptidoglycan-binding domain
MVRTDTVERLQAKADSEATTVSELLRYAIGLAEYVEYARREGARVLVQWPNGDKTEILSRIPSEPLRPPAPSPSLRSRTREAPAEIVPGDRGKRVMQLQRVLKTLAEGDPELDPGKLDGKFGKLTGHAVSVLQQRHHLEVTGKVDAETFETPVLESGASLADLVLA